MVLGKRWAGQGAVLRLALWVFEMLRQVGRLVPIRYVWMKEVHAWLQLELAMHGPYHEGDILVGSDGGGNVQHLQGQAHQK